MSAWRRQLPVHSPLTAGALLAGLRAVTARNGAQARAERHVATLLKDRYASRAVVLTDSGTTALTAALYGARLPVALPAYSCYDVATAAQGARVPVLLYDVDPRTLGPDVAHVRAALQLGARAIVVPHLFGYPADLTELNRLASEAGAVVIEDAAQAAGATLNGRPVGSHASLTVLSFGRGKGWTGGSGGALLAFDDRGVEIVERVRREGTLGPARRGWQELAAVTAQWLFQRPGLYAIPAALPVLRLGETVYRAPRPLRAPAAGSCPIIGASCALAEQEVEIRRRNAARLLVELQRQPAVQTISPRAGARPGFLRLPVLVSATARRSLDDAAARRLGVMPGYPQALCDLEPFGSRCLNHDDSFPGARLLAARLCTLPTHSRLEARDLAGLEQWIRALGTEQRE